MTSPIVFATLIWDANRKSMSFSSMYNDAWVERLYRGFERNTTRPFEFHVWTDRERAFDEPIVQHRIHADVPDFSTCIQPYELNRPMILVGLDTVITGNVDALVDYCFEADQLAVPNAVYRPGRACNGVALVPAGYGWLYDTHDGQNDMDWINAHPHKRIDKLFPGSCVSYKKHVKPNGLQDARIVFFHGKEKPHELNDKWIRDNWV